MLTVEELPVRGLAPLSFELAPGACLAVTGRSGCGKTTLLRALADLDPWPDGAPEGLAARVALDGVPREMLPAPQWRGRVRYFAAESGWWADRVGDHFADWPATLPWLERLDVPATAADWPVARLSSGERQRLAFVRGLIPAPRVLLLDEPTRSLDAAAAGALEAIVAELLPGRCALWVSHDPAQTARVATHRLDLDAASPQVRPGGAR